MKRNSLKTRLLAMIVAALLLGILTGCNPDPGEQTDPIGTTGDLYYPESVGALILNANAGVEITYDAEGLVLSITGRDINGSALVAEYKDYYGKTCSEAVRDLIQDSISSGLLGADAHTVSLIQTPGSQLPGTAFLETVITQAQAGVATAETKTSVTVIVAEELDDNGNMKEDGAKRLLLAYLGVDSSTELKAVSQTAKGCYTYDVQLNGVENRYSVDAATGKVTDYLSESDDSQGGNDGSSQNQGDPDPSVDLPDGNLDD